MSQQSEVNVGGRPPIGPKVQAAIPAQCYELMAQEWEQRCEQAGRLLPFADVVRSVISDGCAVRYPQGR